MSSGDDQDKDDAIVIIGRAETDPWARAIPAVIPGAKLYPCGGCGVRVWVSPRYHEALDVGLAQASCMACMPEPGEGVSFHMPTPEVVEEDLGLAGPEPPKVD